MKGACWLSRDSLTFRGKDTSCSGNLSVSCLFGTDLGYIDLGGEMRQRWTEGQPMGVSFLCGHWRLIPGGPPGGSVGRMSQSFPTQRARVLECVSANSPPYEAEGCSLGICSSAFLACCVQGANFDDQQTFPGNILHRCSN